MASDALMVSTPGFVAAAGAFLFIGYLYLKIAGFKTGADIGEPQVDILSAQIKSGAEKFLKTEYSFLVVFVIALAITLFVLFTFTEGLASAVAVSLSFIFGATLSASAGWWGMMVATDGNAKTTAACATDKQTGKKGTLNDGLKVAFTTGAVMGFAVVGLGLAGVSLCYFLLSTAFSSDDKVMQCLAGFGFGASSIALFARVAGGIYTKAADVGADLVGKVEAGIDEDDPHNPAVIADNVGDNVGDVAGMGADLFESYVGSVIAAATLAAGDLAKIKLAFYLPAVGIVCSIIGYFAVNTKEEGKGWNVELGALMWALEKGMYLAGALFIGGALGVNFVLDLPIEIFFCVIIGLLAGIFIGKFTEYFTSFDFGPVKSIKDRGLTGPATVVIQGLGVGMISCVPPVIILAVSIVSTSALGERAGSAGYGVAISAVGMLSTLGITLATDAYGPVADNAGGLAELSYLDKSVRAITDSLDALGNTTAATGKGFAIGSAVLTALSLLTAFKGKINLAPSEYDIGEPIVLSGVLTGAMLPFLFAALTMISVGKAAAEIIAEVRYQFANVTNEAGMTLGDCIRLYTKEKEHNEDWVCPADKEVKPDSDKCVEISTRSSVQEMIAPGAYAVLAPLVGGFLVGPRFLMGMLAGSIASGCMLAICMANAGGAWDNAKKLCEKLGLKKKAPDLQKACVVGDTVGDPFKDTSGPALNILIKLMSMVSLTVAPLLADYDSDFKYWYFGSVPLAIFIGLTLILIKLNILTWDDPLGSHLKGDGYQMI
uniref:H(+)-exporting diphosphatase n=1 Tax=Calcidiscus leptoporus TaxID=127549 RepID=A0A7S0JBU6_9EUKA|mmetsp:Transcript_49307/g.113962  ORF Transcript_49307/g.113962 Transcript_49307/m.113962 type:complete len:773 (+) Transcript_49307:51-2369(+)|eukprot:CAMPEP_0119351502 /NCGR_PEP_ID=MMETSP1334-20130426/795_1 /TAXON_ID=127549 /ORGANISM="Calcidiscus leptoporus, Strain RCC1130" /LENGTH=772 /DNA_ID=CAMNT_0007364321 /DNA_START=45 /DNA_END=2363 /DNA_ORIENTATION=+